MGTHPQHQSRHHPQRPSKPLSDLNTANWHLPPHFPSSRLSLSPDSYYLQYEMLCADRYQLNLVKIHFTSLVLQRNKDFLLFFLILRTENQVIFVVLSMKLGLCLKVTSDVSSLFNSNNWALLYYASPVPLLWDFCHVRSC